MVSKTAVRIGSIVFRILLNHFIEVMYGLSGHPGIVMSLAIDKQFGSRGWPLGGVGLGGVAVTIQGVGVAFSVGMGVAVTLITIGVDVGVAVGGVGVSVGAAVGGVGVSVGVVIGVVDFNLTATVWLESISI